MPSDLETQVAEAECGKCENGIKYIVRGEYELSCGRCQGTGLRWPVLSQECQPCLGGLLAISCRIEKEKGRCDGSGRIPDATLEKVWDIFKQNGIPLKMEYRSVEEHGYTTLILFVNDKVDDRALMDAACAALLAS